MFKTLRNYLRNRAGSTIIMVGLALPVIFLAVGGAVDFSRVLQLRGEMQDAADVASVGSVAVNSKAFKLALAQGDGEITQGSQQASSIFTSDMRPAPELSNITVNATVSKAATVLTSLVTVSANYKPYMIGLFGFNNLPVSVTSKSSSTIPPYIDFYLLLDNTPSMGLGATTGDITKLQTATSASSLKGVEKNCAFACHESGANANQDNYTVARNKNVNVTLRIDVVRQATQQLMTTAASSETLANQYRVAIYDFGLAADKISAKTPTAYRVTSSTATNPPPSSDLVQAANDAGTIDLMTIPQQNYNSDEQTNYTSVLPDMATKMGTSGDGTSSATPQKVLFFVSDGVNDGYDCSRSDGATCRATTPINPKLCTAIKNNNIRIAVLYTTYQPVTSDSWYNTYVAPWRKPTDQIAANMQACASPGLYFEVGPDQGISEAMTALFNKVVSVVRIRS